MGADFSGYATKAGLKCTDGRTIMDGAFKHQDKVTVPLVWQHGHNTPENILGHVVLEHRDTTHKDGAGVYAYGYFNDMPPGKLAKGLVEHKDINFLSIFANGLVEKSKQVLHGVIREVSLVLAGANPGAKIDFVAIQHADGSETELDDEAIITTGLELEHADLQSDTSVLDVYDAMTEEQQNVVHYMIGSVLAEKMAADNAAAHSDDASEDKNKSDDTSDDKSDKDDLTHKEGSPVTNVFETKDGDTKTAEKHVLSHDAMKGVVADAVKNGSLKAALENYALAHGIDDINILFPDAKLVGNEPEWVARRTEWVAGVLNGVHKTPFSRIKTRQADITHDEARAKGYIKGNLKKEEFFGLAQRTTTPTTIYKKQGLDRDDILDITDFDVVVWMKGEMRLMWEEELARAILIGDGREVDDPDKVKDPAGSNEGSGIRSIANDHELYVTTVTVNLDDANSSYEELVEEVLLARRFYKGSGNPTFYCTEETRVRMLLSKDQFGRRLWANEAELVAALGVGNLVAVEVLENQGDLVGIIVNLSDYNVGADRGGEMTFFDDFDIDYNKYKYLYEGRCSGALTKIKSAMVIRKTAGANVLRTPAAPAFDPETGALTITNQTGVVYKHGATVVNAAGSPYSVPAGTTWTIDATPAAGSYFGTSEDDSWDFTADA